MAKVDIKLAELKPVLETALDGIEEVYANAKGANMHRNRTAIDKKVQSVYHQLERVIEWAEKEMEKGTP